MQKLLNVLKLISVKVVFQPEYMQNVLEES